VDRRSKFHDDPDILLDEVKLDEENHQLQRTRKYRQSNGQTQTKVIGARMTQERTRRTRERKKQTEGAYRSQRGHLLRAFAAVLLCCLEVVLLRPGFILSAAFAVGAALCGASVIRLVRDSRCK
jgi:Flp pilus assembly protein TadB